MEKKLILRRIISWKLFKLFLAIFIPTAIIVNISTIVIYKGKLRREINRHKISDKSHISVISKSVSNDFQEIIADLKILSEYEHLKKMVVRNTFQNRQEVNHTFLSFSKHKKIYDQIRFMNETGREVIRVNFNKGNPTVVQPPDLQDKSKRYYFKDAFKLKEGGIFISPLDLNIEHGKIEKPLKPMLRFGTPVFSYQGQKKGVLLLNYFAQHFLKNIKSINPNIVLLNSQGFWLKSPDPKLEWGFMYPSGILNTYKNHYPKAWEKISQTESGQISTSQGIFTFKTIHPLQEEWISSSGSGKAFKPSAKLVTGKKYRWKIILHLNSTRLNAMASQIKQEFLPRYIITMLLLAITSFVLTYALIIKRKSTAEIIAKNNELEIATSSAIKANKAKSVFLANMSHEFRTPLSAVIGFSQLMLDQDKLSDKYKHFVTLIMDSGEHLLEMISETLDIAKIEAGKLELNEEEFNLRGMVEKLCETMKPLAKEKSIICSNKIELDNSLIIADKTKIRQAITNLLSNAIKYTPSGKKIGVNLFKNENSIFLEIWDEGVGLATKNLDKIFAPFERVGENKTITQGTGLGLAITKKLIEIHGGSIKVESKLGVGSKFIISLPLAIKAPTSKLDTKIEAKYAAPQNKQQKSTVLVVDDDPINIILAITMLQNLNIESDEAKSGEEAIKKAAEKDYDFILMDINMPGIGGIEAMKIIKKTTNSSLIAVTAQTSPGYKEKLLAAGFDDYISKPINMIKLELAVN